jgi:predicted small secreted protein
VTGVFLKKTIMLLLTALLVLLAGCNTMRGLGKDIEQVGDKIQKKAQ